MWQAPDKVLETDGFCVCNTAQLFLGLGMGTQVLYSTSNKRSNLCNPDNTFHTNAFSGRFSFLKQHVQAQETHHLSFSNPCVCQLSNTSATHLLPNASKVGLDEIFPSHGGATSQLHPQLRHCTEPDLDFRKLTCLSVSFPTATATERILGFDVCHCEL